MKERVRRLREESLAARPCISAERALLMTEVYREQSDRHPAPVLRAIAFRELCARQSIWIGPDELIVGERGPFPKATPTYPELTCHSLEDLRILDAREKVSYAVDDEVLRAYEDVVIPFWRGRSLRDRIFDQLPKDWHALYDAGLFTEFMEQRAPGHTAADGKLYRSGLCEMKARVALVRRRLIHSAGPTAAAGLEELRAMDIAADAAIRFAARHARLATRMAETEARQERRTELRRIAEICARVPAHAPRDFHEALQMYWFCHLAVITELNGWDAFSPGHLDQHLEPFYRRGLADGSLSRERAKELLSCLFIKFNNHVAPPKVGVTAAESGTYTDFAQIDLGGVRPDGSDGSSEVSYLLLEVIDELHLVQPSPSVQVSQVTPEAFVEAAARVISHGFGFPSVFNADVVVDELVRAGKTLEDAREGGTTGCVEAGAFGKESYILTGYLNLPKLLELALNDGLDPRTGQQIGPRTGDARDFATFGELFDAWHAQLDHVLEVKLDGNARIQRIYAEAMPAPFLSLITDDCIERALDYNAGGARYDTAYVQAVGIGTLTDALASLRTTVFEAGLVSTAELLTALRHDFEGSERLRQVLRNRAPKWGNDDDGADELMRRAFDALIDAVDGRPNGRGGRYGVDMLPTTCHIYFGSVTGATPDGRHAGMPLSEGISPSQGVDRLGPTAVLLSAAKMDHRRTAGTLLNLKLSPSLLEGDEGIRKLRALVRTYFKLGGHHVQFNVVSGHTLLEAQARPDEHRDLIVRIAGYSDYFCDLSRSLQDEIIARTEHTSV
ncbi:MAG TPA: trans-4-hydroxy-L-proline dehydratase [Candidatus Limnocylindrales bacterium]|nr:trans-4-hydroxy-L-proline dehydratase [Candidatus Limnocylindrales bacterium]